MSGDGSPSDRDSIPGASPLHAVRVAGGIRAGFAADGTTTRATHLSERGGYRLAFPSTFAPHLEALQVNTGGGVVGGDRVEIDYAVGAGADVVHTTSSGERIYRTDGPPAELDLHLSLAENARLDWLPQQTIVYAGAGLSRRITVDMASGSRLLMVEMMTFGRPESRERKAPASIRDSWRINRGGRLVLAEEINLAGEFGTVLDRPAIGGGTRASVMVLLVAPDARDRLELARAALEEYPCDYGVSAWNGLLVLRAMAVHPGELVRAVTRTISLLTDRALPRVWSS